MESVALRVRGAGVGDWVDVEHVGLGPEPARRRRFASTCRSALDLAPGRSGTGAVRRGSARARGVRGSGANRLRGPGAQRRGRGGAHRWRPSTSSGRRCWRPSATTCARRWPGSRPPSAACARPTSSGPTRSAASCLRRSRSPSDRLDGVVGNLLDASRLQAGALSVQLEAVALDEVVGRCSARRYPTRRDRVHVDVPEDLPLGPCGPRPAPDGCWSTSSTTPCATAASDQSVEVGGSHRRLRRPSSRSSTTGRDRDRARRSSCFEPFQRLDDRGHEGVGLGL